jgi:hypothetical protein
MPCDAPGCVQARLDVQSANDRFGWLGKPAEQRSPTAALLRVVWRMQAHRVVTAALYTHPAGTELRVYFEPESAGDLLHSQVERFDVGRSRRRPRHCAKFCAREAGWICRSRQNRRPSGRLPIST